MFWRNNIIHILKLFLVKLKLLSLKFRFLKINTSWQLRPKRRNKMLLKQLVFIYIY